MKKAEVKIGGKYYANVTGKKVEIQIDSEKPSGGWNATNLATGKKIQVKSAQRLHGEVGKGKSATKTQSESQAQPPNEADPDIVPLKPKRSAKKTLFNFDRGLDVPAATTEIQVLVDFLGCGLADLVWGS